MIELLDCTLRDGGYQNAWDFPHALVARYLAALDRTGVRYVELGYRAPSFDGASGPFRYCRDDFVRQWCAPLGLRVAVMIDAAAVAAGDGAGRPGTLRSLFVERAESPVEMVRIAATVDTLALAAGQACVLKALGYTVTVNVMRASLLAPARLAAAASTLDASVVDVLYLADSFGSLDPRGASARVTAMRSAFGGRIGFHAHDNMGMALANSLAAVDAGATLIDGSVRGMGRGGGNLRTELALLELARRGRDDLSATPLHDLVACDFAALQARHEWGATLPYMLSGAHGIHPTYAQELLRDARRDVREVVAALECLATRPGRDTWDPATLAATLDALRGEGVASEAR